MKNKVLGDPKCETAVVGPLTSYNSLVCLNSADLPRTACPSPALILKSPLIN